MRRKFFVSGLVICLCLLINNLSTNAFDTYKDKGVSLMNDLSIKKIKSPSVAGTFYSSDKTALEKQINEFKKASKNTYKTPTRVVPISSLDLSTSPRELII